MINIAVPGVNGRMGMAVAQQVIKADDLHLSLATVRKGNALAGTKLDHSDIVITTEVDNANFDVLIDFTLPVAVIEHLEFCKKHKLAMVIGATGFDEGQLEKIENAAEQIPILLAANMSIGVNVCYKLLAQATDMLDKSWTVSILESHHKEKKDAPSGTAKHMAKVVADQANIDVGTITITSERLDEEIGTHTVSFSSLDETIKISHFAHNRELFAKGAIQAARWIYAKPAGLYSMQDVIR